MSPEQRMGRGLRLRAALHAARKVISRARSVLAELDD